MNNCCSACNMKRVFALLSITLYASFCLAEDDKPEMPPIMKECLEENGLDEEFLLKLLHDKDTSLIDQSKCFTYCIMDKFNILDDTKHIQFEEFKERLTPMLTAEDAEKIAKLEEACPDVKAEMNCDTARAFQKCLLEM